jgi:fructokinase
VVSVTATGQPDYAFYRQGVADRAVNAASLVNACESQSDLRIVYTGCLALSPDDAAVYLPWLQQCRAAGQTVVVDINLRPSVMPDLPAYRANIWAALQHAHIAKASDEDLAILAVPGDTPLAQARYVLAHSSADIMLLTLGADGACLLTRDGKAWVARESKPVCVVDTVGAGDCFLAGFVAAWLRLQQGQIEENAPLLLAHGLASASLCVMQQGCVPPDQAQVSERVAEVGRVFERLSD